MDPPHAGLDLEGFPDLSSPSPATNWIRVLAICKYRPFSDADHTTKLRLTAACLLAGAAQPGPAGRYSIGASEMEHLLSVTCPASWEGLPAFDASRLEALQVGGWVGGHMQRPVCTNDAPIECVLRACLLHGCLAPAPQKHECS
jgi:hypothetical protein